MDLLLDLLQAAGLGAAAGLGPFVAALVAGGFASADTGVDFGGTDFAFLERPWWLLAMALALVAAVALRDRAQQVLGATGIGLGGLLGAGVVADRSEHWWAGLVVGLLCAAVAAAAATGLLGRVRARLDASAAGALPLYALGAAAVVGLLAVVLPPVSLLVVGFLAVLLRGGRRRAGEKFAGLRILR